MQSIVLGDVVVSPKQIFLGFINPGKTKVVNINLSSTGGKAVEITRWELEKEQVARGEILVEKTEIEGELLVRVTPLEEHLIDNSLIIHTNILGEERIVVPISALISKSAPDHPTVEVESQGISKILDPSHLPLAEDAVNFKIGTATPPFKIGDKAPDFRTLDAEGKSWQLSALRGEKNIVLTFFPKCFTGGCTNHLSSLRDHQKEFDATNTQILAISVDPAGGEKGQLAFVKQWGLTFPLIPDISRQLGKQFGAIQNDDELAARMSILLDKAGVVRWIDTDVHVQTHGADVLAKIKELGITK